MAPTQVTSQETLPLPILTIAPAQVIRGTQVFAQRPDLIQHWGQRLLVVGGDRTLEVAKSFLGPAIAALEVVYHSYGHQCSEAALQTLTVEAAHHRADCILGVGGGKALDLAKLLAHQLKLPVITVPTSAATCAAWTALANVYSEAGAFQYDVSLSQCPTALVLDYDLIQTAPLRTLVAGIGDAIAKWYEASVSSGHSTQTLVIAAVQQARVLRDLLFQQAAIALNTPGSAVWREVVDASVLMAGVMGGLGGAQCRTVAAHAVHNGLTHYANSHTMLHGEKVAYGILVQLRLEEMIQGNQLAIAARQQLLKFYTEIGLPKSLEELGLASITLTDLNRIAAIACAEHSDIHRLPFAVAPSQLVAAMVSTITPTELTRNVTAPPLEES
jgi:glycerol dehydrogenase